MKRLSMYIVLGIVILSLLLTGCGGGTKTKVTVAMDATWPPFESINESSKAIEGFDVDMIKAIAEKGGFEVELVNVTWDPLLAGMATCQYDLAASAMTITDERKKNFNFSDPYFAAGQIVTVRTSETTINGKDDLVGKKIGTQLETTGDIEAKKIDGATVKAYDDIGLAFQDLMNGQVDAVIADNPLALQYVSKNADKLKTVGATFTDEYYGVAVCKDKKDLLDKVNKGLAAIKSDGTLDKLAEKWGLKVK